MWMQSDKAGVAFLCLVEEPPGFSDFVNTPVLPVPSGVEKSVVLFVVVGAGAQGGIWMSIGIYM